MLFRKFGDKYSNETLVRLCDKTGQASLACDGTTFWFKAMMLTAARLRFSCSLSRSLSDMPDVMDAGLGAAREAAEAVVCCLAASCFRANLALSNASSSSSSLTETRPLDEIWSQLTSWGRGGH